MRAMEVRLARPQTGEEEIAAIRTVLESGVLTNGPKTPEFERALADMHEATHGIALANGTVALAAMLIANGIQPGDEVIVPSMTFIATATSVLHVGATPVFADILPDTFDLDPSDVGARVTPRTRAIVAVHYAGQPADLPALAKIADDNGLILLEDAAQAHGARLDGRPVGAWGTAMFSFTPTKNVTTGEGAIVLTRDDQIAERIRLLRNHGMVSPYRSDTVGYNWRITEMQAAMGIVQLGKLPAILARKRRNAAWLTDRLRQIPGVTPPAVRTGAEHTYMLYTVLLAEQTDRDAVLAYLLAHQVEAKIYYPPAHTMPIFAGHATDLPVTTRIAARMLSLPVHAGLSTDELGRVVDVLADAVGRHTGS